jgi:CheY-like chemotaxis protein
VEVVGDGEEAFKRLRGGRFDALLTDWMMPEMDGVTLIRESGLKLKQPRLF